MEHFQGPLATAHAHYEAGQLAEAEAICRQVLLTQSMNVDAWQLLGAIAHEMGNRPLALHSLGRALELNPNHAETYNNLGIASLGERNPGPAIAYFTEAVKRKPDFAEAHYNLGFALDGAGDFERAEASYRRAIEIKPDYAEAHWNLSHLLLAAGDFEHGWREYEWRWSTSQGSLPERAGPKWNGEPLRGKTILLYTEQGFGDAFQFIRFANLLKLTGAKVVVECKNALVNVLASCPGIDRLIGSGDDLP